MTKHGTTRHGSLQFYPRVRAKAILPSVNWRAVNSSKGSNILGFICYKVGMLSAFVKDNTPNSLTKGQRIIIPVTILECPTLRILSTRFYKQGKLIGEVMNQHLDKELKRKIRFPKNHKKTFEHFKEGDYDDLRIIAYSQVKKTGIKKAPDIAELALTGSVSEKLDFIKNHLTKDISVKDILKDEVVDVRGVTIGKGLQGTIKRFGLTLKGHKSEKGQRTLGSGGPWHPSRVDFSQPRAGQMGFFTRVTYNSKVVAVEDIKKKDINPKQGFKHYGYIKNDYVVLYGSVQGPTKRQLIITCPIRPSKSNIKKNYELLEVR